MNRNYNFIILLSFFFTIINGCIDNNNSNNNIKNKNDFGVKILKDSDTLFLNKDLDSIINYIIKPSINLVEFQPKIEREVTLVNGIETEEYQMTTPYRIKFSISKAKNVLNRNIHFNGHLLSKQYIYFNSDNEFPTEINIDYKSAEFYKSSNDEIILTRSSPTTFTGLMMNFAFYQLIDLKKNKVYEYYNFRSIPKLFLNKKDRSISIIKIDGDYSPELESWTLICSNRSLLEPNKLKEIPLDIDYKKGKIINYIVVNELMN